MESPLYSSEQAVAAIDIAIEAATRLGCAAAAAITAGEGLSVDVRGGDVETVEHHRDKSLSVTLYHGQQKGSASTTDFDPDSIIETVAAAERIARHAEADPYAGLVDPRYLAREIPELDLDHPWDLSVAEAIEIARECEAEAKTAHAKVSQVDESSVGRYRGLRVYANTDGFRGAQHGTRHSISCVVVGEELGQMQRGHWYSVARRASELERPGAVGRKAAERTVARLGARKISTRKAPVLFEARIASSLIGHLVAAVSGAALYREATFLKDAAGTRIFPDFFEIDEQPHLPRGLGSAAFDAEGVITRPRKLIDAGVLTGYVLDSYAARRLKLEPTGHAGGTHNLLVAAQGKDFAALLQTMDSGLLVTDLMGFGINMITGDYSRGASGFWVEHGRIQFPVEEITIASNLRDMFRGIVAAGTDLDRRSSTITGSILIDQMTVAGD